MPERILQFEDLSVHQALGIRQGEGFKIEDLSGCINIIHGRNGSGKSTTARVIQELLWPGKTDLGRAAVSGSLRDEERLWEVLVEPGHREWRLNRTVEAGPELGPPEIRHRYRLSLEELVSGDDQRFAEEIAAATQGGFDLEEAGRRAEFNRTESATADAATLRDADDAWLAVSERQKNLQQEEGRREMLKSAVAEATNAAERLPQLHKIREHRNACRHYEDLQARLDVFPEEMEKLQGNEREELNRLHSLTEDSNAALRDAERKIAEAQAVQNESGADLESSQEICDRLKARLPQLQRLENSIEQEGKAVWQTLGEAAELRKRLGKNFSEDQVDDLSSAQFPELSDFTRRIISFTAEQRVNEERRKALEDATVAELPEQSFEQLHDGVRSLREWLASAERTGSGISRLLPVVLSLLALASLSVFLGVTRDPIWFAGLVAALGLAAWELLQRKGRNQATIRAVHEADYIRSGLPVPAEWTADVVSDQLRNLTDLAVKRRAEEDRQRDLAQLQTQSERLKEQRDELEKQRRELSERLGPDLELSEEWLPRFIDNLTRWQDKCTAASGHEQALAHLEKQRDELLAQMNADLAQIGQSKADSSEAAGQSIHALEARLDRHRAALRDEAEADRDRRRINSRLEELAGDRDKIFQRLGVSRETEGKIDEWLNRREDYLASRSALREAEIVRDQRQADIAGFEPVAEEDIDTLIAETQATADRRENLRDEITSIQVRIENAKAGRELSDALEAKDRAMEKLRDIHERHLARAAGNRLAEWLRIQNSQGTRPQVFKRAKELLRKFTNNRLQLDMDDRTVPPRFIARRSETSASPVSELSVGERMQLLAAVRLAFIELNENIRLPLLLDEVLGTSDDERASAIIDTVITIAKDGRQVFYFTAQLDEVGKWVSRLNETNTEHRIIDLDLVRDTTANPARPIPASPVQLMPPPRPVGDDHQEYGRKLRITFFDPWDESSTRLHLWHVIDDVQLLYKMLRKQVTSWWQLKQLPEADREKLFPGSNGALNKAEAVAKAIEIASRAWRVGRCRPVTRQVLFNSRVVTDRYFEDLAKLAEQFEGDAHRIIEGLDNRLISGWRRAKTNELRSYFSAHGYLVTNHPQSRTDIHRRVVASLTDELEQGRLTPEQIDQIINSLPDLD